MSEDSVAFLGLATRGKAWGCELGDALVASDLRRGGARSSGGGRHCPIVFVDAVSPRAWRAGGVAALPRVPREAPYAEKEDDDRECDKISRISSISKGHRFAAFGAGGSDEGF